MAKAGQYELLDLYWDEVTSKPDAPRPTFKRHLQGEVLTLDEEEATRLVDAGSVAEKGAREAAELARAEQAYLAALANLPDHLRAAVAEKVDAEAVATAEVPQEALTVNGVNPAPGFVNEGHPQYANAAHGQGSGDGPEDTTAADLAATQAALDDGPKTATDPARKVDEAKQPNKVAGPAKKA